MVDNFSRQQLATKHLFCDDAMLKGVSACVRKMVCDADKK